MRSFLETRRRGAPCEFVFLNKIFDYIKVCDCGKSKLCADCRGGRDEYIFDEISRGADLLGLAQFTDLTVDRVKQIYSTQKIKIRREKARERAITPKVPPGWRRVVWVKGAENWFCGICKKAYKDLFLSEFVPLKKRCCFCFNQILKAQRKRPCF